MNQRVYFDENGVPYALDEKGNKVPPLQSERIIIDSGFVNYDTVQGHCGLCGKLTCNGSCFK